MRIALIPLPQVPGWKVALAPVAAILLTLALAFCVLALAGYDAPTVARQMFLDPVLQMRRWPDLLVKAGPLIMIAIGLSLGFRAGVWNIGAEGQYIMGALAGTGVALATDGMTGVWILPLMLVAGVAGGAAWAAIPALLKTRAGVSEILSSLMLTYVAIQVLYYMVRGPWKDPAGFNFPQTIMFGESQTLPPVMAGSLVHWGIPLAFVIAGIVWFLMGRTLFGFESRATGASPQAARYGGFSPERTVWMTLLAGGGLAGLAGICEAAGPFTQLTPQFPVNYGFTAIIVAFLGRLNPLGVVAAGLALAVTYVGGEIAQSASRLPQAATGVFQAMMLFLLLAADVLVRHRIQITRSPR